MAKKRPYPNTSWGREAEAEDQESRIEQQVANVRPRTYHEAYEAAKGLMGKGQKSEAIREALHKPPPFDPQNPPSSEQERIDYGVAAGLARLRLEAIGHALAGLKPEHVWPRAAPPK